MKSSGPRIVVIGLELGDGKLIEGWARRGKLPYLASLLLGG
jgi:hypothetical protein